MVSVWGLTLVSVLVLASCGTDETSNRVTYEDQQLCINEAQRTYERTTGRGPLRFTGTDAYYYASKDCRDGRFRGFPDAALQEERQAARETERQKRQQENAQQEAERANRERERREAAIDEEWDRIGCGDSDVEFSKAEEQRCDELSGVSP